MILCSRPIKKLPLSGNCFASQPLCAGLEPGRWRRGGRAQGSIVGEGVGESWGTHRTSSLMNAAFLECTQRPIHRSPQGTSLNKYGQRFSPIWKPSLPISQRKQASQWRIEVSPLSRGAHSEARAVKCRCGSKTPQPISFSNLWKDGEEGRARVLGF